jgi:hypothetical protein
MRVSGGQGRVHIGTHIGTFLDWRGQMPWSKIVRHGAAAYFNWRRDNYATLDFALNGITQLHGYLSSPTGGGVRHGLDCVEGIPMNSGEARLFCNLIRSYADYLLHEHERIVTEGEKSI